MAARQVLGHSELPEFVGNIQEAGPYRPEQPAKNKWQQ
jgi:hypothetical protein